MKRKGFTLIELLAVIVVLAIIALIAVPIVVNLIEDSRKGAAERSAVGYVESVKNKILKNMLKEEYIEAGTYNYDIVEAEVNGSKPTSGTITLDEKGNIESALLCINNRAIEYKNGNAKQIKNICKGIMPASFSEDDWVTIVNAVKMGNTSAYKVGDTKEINLGNDLGTHTLRIANISTPEECNTEGFSQTACGFVVEFEDIIVMNKINTTSTTSGGWPATTIRTYINDTIYNALSDDLKNVIIDTLVVSDGFKSTDKIYLLSAEEVFGTKSQTSRQLDYYINGSSDSRLKKRNGNNTYWWLRSINGSSSFRTVSDTGSSTGTTVTYSEGVSPAFKIG